MKGHTDERTHITTEYIRNRQSDLVSKYARTSAITLLDEAWNDVDEFFLTINGTLFEGNIRKYLKREVSNRVHSHLTMSSQTGARFDFTQYWKKPLAYLFKLPVFPDYLRSFHFRCMTRTLPTH